MKAPIKTGVSVRIIEDPTHSWLVVDYVVGTFWTGQKWKLANAHAHERIVKEDEIEVIDPRCECLIHDPTKNRI